MYDAALFAAMADELTKIAEDAPPGKKPPHALRTLLVHMLATGAGAGVGYGLAHAANKVVTKVTGRPDVMPRWSRAALPVLTGAAGFLGTMASREAADKMQRDTEARKALKAQT